MADIFDEARASWKQERMIALLKTYGGYLAAVGVALIIGVASWQWWQGREARAAKAASYDYFMALEAVRAGNVAEGGAKLAAVADGNSSYAPLAALLHAGMLAGEKKTEEAIAQYHAIADSGADRAMRDLALLQASALELPTAEEKALKNLDALSKSGRPWRMSALEITAFHLLNKKDYPKSREAFMVISTDPEAPSQLRTRAADMLLYLDQLEAK